MAQDASAAPLLVDAGWLAERIASGAPGMVVLDLGDLRPYRSSHIPGAIHSYWLETVERDYPYFGTVLNQWDEDGANEHQGKRRAWMRRHGIGPDAHVVAYDRGDGRRAARIVWLLHFLGYARASLLDGGFGAWHAAGHAVVGGDEPPPPSTEPVVNPQSGFYLGTGELAEALEEPETLLVDIRSNEELHDTVGGQFATGAIPGSIRAPWDTPAFSVADPTRSFNADAARAALSDFGVDPDRRIVLYGRFGCDTNQMWLVLTASGYSRVEVYDRGWVEWSESGRLSEPIPSTEP